jgi:hypothetical protein
MAPTLAVARKAITVSGILGRTAATRSPASTPIDCSQFAALRTFAASSRRLMVMSGRVSDLAMRAGSRSCWLVASSAKFSRRSGNHSANGMALLLRTTSTSSGDFATPKYRAIDRQNSSRSATDQSQSSW